MQVCRLIQCVVAYGILTCTHCNGFLSSANVLKKKARTSSASSSGSQATSQADVEPRLVARRIQACLRTKDVTQALELVQRYYDKAFEKTMADTSASPDSSDCDTTTRKVDSKLEAPFVQALHVCSKAGCPDKAIHIYELCPSPQCRKLTISILGKSGRNKEAMDLLLKTENVSGHEFDIGSYNALIAACGKSGAWEDVMLILEHMPKGTVTSITCHAVIDALGKAKQGAKAVELLNRFPSDFEIEPTRTTYHLVLQALVREGDLDHAVNIWEQCQNKKNTIDLHDGTRDLLIAACGKAARWDLARLIQYNEASLDGQEDSQSGPTDYYFQPWECVQRIGQGKTAYWKVGTFTCNATHCDGGTNLQNGINVTIGLQPNRNPRKNGMKLLLVDEEMDERFGFLLMINQQAAPSSTQKQSTMSDNASSSLLLGLRIDESRRSEGWSKIFLAIWFELCFSSKLNPITGKIRKPLLALVLQHTFELTPQGGVKCELVPTQSSRYPDSITIFSNSARSLLGAFSPWDRESQRIVLSERPLENGRPIRVGATWSAATTTNGGESKHSHVQERSNSILQGRFRASIEGDELRKMLLGL